MGIPSGNKDLETDPPAGRLVTGGIVFVGSFLAPIFIPLVISTDWAESTKTAISGFLALGAPELGMLIAVGILGKSGFQFLKHILFSSLSRIVFPDRVGPARHRIDVFMFVAPLVFGWAQPYVASLYPESGIQQPIYAGAGDIVFFLSLFVLGGEFWEKLRALFVRD